MCIFDLHTSKARYELKVVHTSPPLARECKDDSRIYYNILLANFFIDKIAA
jgi:hypothetical protein